MEVELVATTFNPAVTVACAGKSCYSDKPAHKILLTPEGVDHTLDVIHPSCYEHAVFTFSISGISRVTSHQLVRHRMASYSQQSQRYVKPNLQVRDVYAPLFEWVVPKSVKDSPNYEADYDHIMRIISDAYERLLAAGVPEEDARYLLPNACTTNIVVTMNARELQHFCGLRRCSRAQWEIRELANKMAQAAEDAYPELFKHFSLGPQCEQLGYCPEHKGCGRRAPLETLFKYEKGTIIVPEFTPEQIEEMRNKIIATMESIDAIPIVALPTDTRESKVTDKTRTAEDGRQSTWTTMSVKDWTDPNKTYSVQLGKGIIGEGRESKVTDKTRTAEEYREDGYEDLAKKEEVKE